jgi:hypothetical protein
MTGLLLDVGSVVEQVATELKVSAHERRQTNERLDRLLRSQAETRQVLGQTELHIPQHHTRRRPLGH